MGGVNSYTGINIYYYICSGVISRNLLRASLTAHGLDLDRLLWGRGDCGSQAAEGTRCLEPKKMRRKPSHARQDKCDKLSSSRSDLWGVIPCSGIKGFQIWGGVAVPTMNSILGQRLLRGDSLLWHQGLPGMGGVWPCLQ